MLSPVSYVFTVLLVCPSAVVIVVCVGTTFIIEDGERGFATPVYCVAAVLRRAPELCEPW
jgi:hypothetical protein